MRVVFYDSASGSLGIQYLLAVLKDRGHEVGLYLDRSLSRDHLAQDLPGKRLLSLSPTAVARELLALTPDLACFSMSTFSYRSMLELIRAVKQLRPDVTIVCGGVHPTLVPAVVLENPEVDFVVVGEGEISFPKLVDALAQASDAARVKALPRDALPGVWNLCGGVAVDRGLSPAVQDLDRLPFPDKRLYAQANPAFRDMYAVAASRGCVYACTYCNSATLNRLYRQHRERYYRVRSVDNVLAELRQAVELYRPRYVVFYDDVFGFQLPWLEEFSRKYRDQIDLPYGIQTHPGALDEERLQLLADSHCVALEIGLQSANARVRSEVLNRYEREDNIPALIQRAKELGMLVELDLIVNLPGETAEHEEEMLRFVGANRPELVNVGFLQYFPKTPIIDTAIAQGLICLEDIPRLERGEGVSMMRLLSASNLKARQRILPLEVFVASRLPRGLAPGVIRGLRLPLARQVCSFLASYLLYATRLWISLTDKRDFYHRVQIRRLLYAGRTMTRRKAAGILRRPSP